LNYLLEESHDMAQKLLPDIQLATSIPVESSDSELALSGKQ